MKSFRNYNLITRFFNNLWIVSEPNLDLIFDKDAYNKWLKALSTLGISKYDFVPEIAIC